MTSIFKYSTTGRVVKNSKNYFEMYTTEDGADRCSVFILDNDGNEICSSEDNYKPRLTDDQLKRWCNKRSDFDHDLLKEFEIAKSEGSLEMKAQIGHGKGTLVTSVSIPNSKLEVLLLHLQYVLGIGDFRDDLSTYNAIIQTRTNVLTEYCDKNNYTIIDAKHCRNLLRVLNVVIADIPYKVWPKCTILVEDVVTLRNELNNSLCQIGDNMEL